MQNTCPRFPDERTSTNDAVLHANYRRLSTFRISFFLLSDTTPPIENDSPARVSPSRVAPRSNSSCTRISRAHDGEHGDATDRSRGSADDRQ
mmetsp:Transcript_34227/g.105756  ORF Transcript_34227/g.105756 Transcript_34227/m.105756 type:complete len:92 (+) Transcript_34227:536-811(+)